MNRGLNGMPRWICAGAAVLALAIVVQAGPKAEEEGDGAPRVTTVRVPNGGIQPQITVDSKGILHLIYYTGDPGHGDLFYLRSRDFGRSFSEPIQVNSHPGSAIATGNIRGAHIAAGRNGRVHVAWNGTYELDRPGVVESFMKKPMVYTHLNEAGTAFDPERNVIQAAYGLDGGGALAADGDGDVYVFWHAPTPGTRGEENRRVWMARSTDDGKTFDREKPAFDQPTGACGCCGMEAFASRNHVFVLFRSATEIVHRDMYLLTSVNRGLSFQGTDISQWNIGACVMSSANIAEGPGGVLAAWETMGNVYYGLADPSAAKLSLMVAAPGEPKGRKYPAVAGNSRGETLLAWTEGMGWQKGGSLAWQIFDRQGRPEGTTGHADGVPRWSLIAAFARPDGGFTIVY
jgi:hypothetical protein